MSSKDYYKRPSGVVCEKRQYGREFNVGSCLQKKWVIWVLMGTGTANWRPEASLLTVHGLFQMEVVFQNASAGTLVQNLCWDRKYS